MKMNVWHFLISYQLTSLLPCKVFSSLLLFQTKYFPFLLSSAWPTRQSFPSCRRPWPGSYSRTTTMGRLWAASSANHGPREVKFKALWKVLGVQKRPISCLKTYKSICKHCLLCYTKIPKNPGIVFSIIPGSGLKSNPGIPGFFGIPLDTDGDQLSGAKLSGAQLSEVEMSGVPIVRWS